MANLTNAFKLELLDGILGVNQLTTPSEVFIALFTGTLDDVGSVATELNTLGYTRISINSLFSPAVGSSGASYNTGVIHFNEALDDWGTINSIGIMKSSVVGADDMMLWSILSVPSLIALGHIAKFNIGDLFLQVD